MSVCPSHKLSRAHNLNLSGSDLLKISISALLAPFQRKTEPKILRLVIKHLLNFLIREALGLFGCADAISLVSSRDEVDDLLKLDNYIDLIIPRGSNELVRSGPVSSCHCQFDDIFMFQVHQGEIKVHPCPGSR